MVLLEPPSDKMPSGLALLRARDETAPGALSLLWRVIVGDLLGGVDDADLAVGGGDGLWLLAGG